MNLSLQWQIYEQSYRHTVTPSETVLIGRHPDCDIEIPNDSKYRSVSRRHARIYTEAGAFRLCNLSRKNKIRVNGQHKLKANEVVLLSDGDLFRVGPVEFRVNLDGGAGQTELVRCHNPKCDLIVARSKQFCPECGFSLADADTTR